MKLSLLPFLLLSSIACAGVTDGEADENVDSTEDEIAISWMYEGSWKFSNEYVDMRSIVLRSDRTYEAEIDSKLIYPNARIPCTADKCTEREQGTFRVFTVNRQRFLALNPNRPAYGVPYGASRSSRVYPVQGNWGVETEDQMTLKNWYGVSFKMKRYSRLTPFPFNPPVD